MLMGCDSIRVAGSQNRLVYTYSAARDEVTVLAIGRRHGSEVYREAGKRLQP